jgi:uncharacterized protein (DUF1697 family)
MAMREARRVALLRGVNVGGKNKLAMRELCAVFEAAGCTESESYIQSGNVVFRSELEDAALQIRLAAAIEEQFGFAVPVVVRTAAEMQMAIDKNPFVGVAEERLAVMFLRDRPTAEALVRMEAERFLPERFAVVGGEVYLDMPRGAGRSKMTTAYFDGRLKTVGTVRNLRTVRTLVKMAGVPQSR